MMRRVLMMILAAGGVFLTPCGLMADAESTREMVEKLNQDDTVRGEDSVKAWRILFDAYLAMTPPPRPVGDSFNQETIWPGMSDWGAVSKWAAENSGMAEAIIKASDRMMIGLPYGCDRVPQHYSEEGVCVAISIEGGYRELDFRYFDAVRTMAAFSTAEVYRRFEIGDVDGAISLLNANLWMLRMFCDRQFMSEKMEMILLLTDSLANMRDCFYTYMDRISPEQYKDIALRKIPFLRPDRSRLLIPEADRIVAEVVLDEVFDHDTGDPIADRFSEVFTRIQSEGEPLTRMGAAARWRAIANRHASHLASKERLQLIYDDWWRQWRIRDFTVVSTLPSEFDKANSMRYAGVLLSIKNIQDLFAIRNNLRVAVYGTAISAGLCAFKQREGEYPADVDKKVSRLYGTYLARLADKDPYNYRQDLKGLDSFTYLRLDEKMPLEVANERIWLDKGQAILYSYGENHTDDHGKEHVQSGKEHDIIIWPPVKALLRQDGVLK